MGDTWLDNLYANFRVPPSPRMRRLLADRGSFWIGGAYCGTELPWESIGCFGWEPTATPNTFRYEWGVRTFGSGTRPGVCAHEPGVRALVGNQCPIPAARRVDEAWRRTNGNAFWKRVQHHADLLRRRLAGLKEKAGGTAHAAGSATSSLFAPFIEYHLHRLDLFGRIHDLRARSRGDHQAGDPLPNDVRRTSLVDTGKSTIGPRSTMPP